MEEEWVQVKECPNYAVSSHGRVMNIMRSAYVGQRETPDGGLRVSLFDKGRQKDFYVHHLVYQAWYGAITPGDQIIHVDGDKHNNVPDNLRHRRRNRAINPENHPLGNNVASSKRHWGRRVMIQETGQIFRSVRDCALFIEGDFASIYACLRGQRQKHKGFTYEYVR